MTDQARPVHPLPHTHHAAYRWLVRELRRLTAAVRRAT